jgi:valyl-tRNA synthetase
LELATVRLETKFGDTAVAINPKDKRYQKYVGQEIEIETLLGKRKIKVIADEAVDMEFGTGVVKITPAHDPDDFEVWQRHKSEIPPPIQVIDRFGKLTDKAGPYKGMKVLEARKIIADDMTKKGLLDPTKTDHHYKHNVAVCYKCGSLIEPMILDNQWFIKTTAKPKKGKLSLRDAAVKAVKKGEIKFVSKRFEKIFFHWMKNLKDWNISRQIPWGIKIPDSQDVFDTWFSSGQWPFATLKTTGKNDFKTFYPTSVMETAWDILFFWVARMIMFGLYCTGKEPFKYVYIHGLVRDKDRQKMSKSKGNVVDPLGIVKEQGADALRMSLVFGTGAGNDIVVSEDKVIAQKRFANKLWQASKFVLTSLGKNFDSKIKEPKYSKNDKWILKELEKTVKKVTEDIDKFRFHEAAQEIYQFFWHKFCDKTIEDVKIRIREKTKNAQIGKFTLLTVLSNSLKLLHPFLPFITEEIYQKLPIKNKKKCLMIEEWPNTNFKF